MNPDDFAHFYFSDDIFFVNNAICRSQELCNAF